MESSVCIVDFCGNDSGFPTSFSADYYPAIKALRFSGDWSEVPDMPALSEPTQAKAYQWARVHGA